MIYSIRDLVELKKAGPFIGPRGGKWADAAHKIPWKESKARKPAGRKPSSAALRERMSVPAKSLKSTKGEYVNEPFWQNFRQKPADEQIAWAENHFAGGIREPVGVRIYANGVFGFDDGHHRVRAAALLGEQVPIIIERNQLQEKSEELWQHWRSKVEQGFHPAHDLNPDSWRVSSLDHAKELISHGGVRYSDRPPEVPKTSKPPWEPPWERLATTKKSSLFIGPRGGKWADPRHKIPWKPERKARKPAKKESSEKRRPPGSQLSKADRDKLRVLGVTKLPEAAIPVGDIAMDFSDPDTTAVIKWWDAAGRLQAGYTPKFHKDNAAKKWARISGILPQMPKIRRRLKSQLEASEPGSREEQGLLIANIIMHTGLRVGSEKMLEGRYGVSTLLSEHITITGDKVFFEFIGKQNKVNTGELRSKAIASVLKRYLKDPETPVFSKNIEVAARRVLPKVVLLKDFRAVVATQVGKRALSEHPPPPPPLTGNRKKDKKLLLAGILAASKAAADVINNTPAIARSTYILPSMFSEWATSMGAPPDLVAEIT